MFDTCIVSDDLRSCVLIEEWYIAKDVGAKRGAVHLDGLVDVERGIRRDETEAEERERGESVGVEQREAGPMSTNTM